ncbi:MAG: rhodanese-like domain-containing protein, partial [Pseudomonadota bacterium]
VDNFSKVTSEAVLAKGGNANTEIFFLCRSGVRSQGAAAALTEVGFENCFNVAGGFEGPPDGSFHRGTIDGWKAKGLPWRQT